MLAHRREAGPLLQVVLVVLPGGPFARLSLGLVPGLSIERWNNGQREGLALHDPDLQAGRAHRRRRASDPNARRGSLSG